MADSAKIRFVQKLIHTYYKWRYSSIIGKSRWKWSRSEIVLVLIDDERLDYSVWGLRLYFISVVFETRLLVTKNFTPQCYDHVRKVRSESRDWWQLLVIDDYKSSWNLATHLRRRWALRWWQPIGYANRASHAVCSEYTQGANTMCKIK